MSQRTSQSNTFDPEKAKYFDLIHKELNLTEEELAKLKENRFVVTDRLTFDYFKRAYAWIYWKDLPVVVTADAILHSIHQTYSAMLKQVEMTILTDKFITLLSNTRDYLRANLAEPDTQLRQLQDDLHLYLEVPLSLLGTPTNQDDFESLQAKFEDLYSKVDSYLEQISVANSISHDIDFREDGTLERRSIEIGVETITLFGLTREIDMTQFRARGHYDKPHRLLSYFCAIMWLQLMNFHLVEYDLMAKPIVHRKQLAGAYLLVDYLQKSGQMQVWLEIEELLSAFIGWSDNITLQWLQKFFEDAHLTSIDDCLTADEDSLYQLLITNDYGQQKIRGQIQQRHTALQDDLPHDIVFSLFGQRYTLESDIIQQLVYDKLIVDGERIPRAFPSPFDVLYALGNNQALSHLSDELEKYGYHNNLEDVRQWVSSHSDEFWENSFYNHWLKAILTLNQPTTADTYATSMQSSAWADKTLHTQLASWTELRHDNILYVKPPYSTKAICDYPAGYVEPYPELYRQLQKYAQFGRQVFEKITYEDFDESDGEIYYRTQTPKGVRDKAITYFEHLGDVMATLHSLAEKELAGQPFTEEDNLFLRSIVVRKYVGDMQYGGWARENWNGWYIDLMPFGDERPYVVTDVHSNFNPALGQTGVLHLGIDEPVMMIFSAETGNVEETLYVGPVYTVRQHLHAKTRLKDEEWQYYLNSSSTWSVDFITEKIADTQQEIASHQANEEIDEIEVKILNRQLQKWQERLNNAVPKSPPIGSKSYRVSHPEPESLSLPETAYDAVKQALSPQLRAKFDTVYDDISQIIDNLPHFGRKIGVITREIENDPELLEDVNSLSTDERAELIEVLKALRYLK